MILFTYFLKKLLNLKPHYVGSFQNRKYLWMAGDVEGHLGRDNRFYLIDFSRTLPPTQPDTKIHSGSVTVFSHTTKTFLTLSSFIRTSLPIVPSGIRQKSPHSFVSRLLLRIYSHWPKGIETLLEGIVIFHTFLRFSESIHPNFLFLSHFAEKGTQSRSLLRDVTPSGSHHPHLSEGAGNEYPADARSVPLPRISHRWGVPQGEDVGFKRIFISLFKLFATFKILHIFDVKIERVSRTLTLLS